MAKHETSSRASLNVEKTGAPVSKEDQKSKLSSIKKDFRANSESSHIQRLRAAREAKNPLKKESFLERNRKKRERKAQKTCTATAVTNSRVQETSTRIDATVPQPSLSGHKVLPPCSPSKIPRPPSGRSNMALRGLSTLSPVVAGRPLSRPLSPASILPRRPWTLPLVPRPPFDLSSLIPRPHSSSRSLLSPGRIEAQRNSVEILLPVMRSRPPSSIPETVSGNIHN